MRRFLLTILLAANAAGARAQQPPLMVNPDTHETEQQFAARTAWWREAKFGMFIHWGVYAVPADETTKDGGKSIAEWYFSNKQAQMKDYEKFASQFNPVHFNAHQWVKAAKDAGMKYIVITTKHHDGFDMYGTKLNHDWNIVDSTPFHRDPMKELAEECRKQGVRLCFYYSIMDWHQQDYIPRRPWETNTRPATGASLDRYIDYLKGQLKELLTNYGPVGIIWFDGGWEHNEQELHSAEVNKLIRSLQPGILINDRDHLHEDYSTPEQTIPANAMTGGRLWETCMTINDTWGYAKNDTDWKSPEDLIHKLCDISHKGGNFLLNVGPTGLGDFPEPIVERLDAIGDWMRVNSTSIYGTTKSPFRRLPFDGRCTQKGDTLYLQVFRWPDDGLHVEGLQTQIISARALLGNEMLPVTKADANTVYIGRPRKLDSVATVVELQFAARPVISDAVAEGGPVHASADGSFALKASEASIHGDTAQYENGGGKDNIGFWTDKTDYVTWSLDVPRSGSYDVTVTYACENGNAGSKYTVGAGSEMVSGTVDGTASWTDFKEVHLGRITLPPGNAALAVRITDMPHGAAMNLKAVRLAPAPQATK